MAQPNPNLWAVDIVDKKTNQVQIALYVCAANVGKAAEKAQAHAKGMGFRAFVVRDIVHKGTIDVF